MTAFGVNGHVVINDHEGKVIRLTPMATVLVTLDGNHLGPILCPDEQVAAEKKIDATQATRRAAAVDQVLNVKPDKFRQAKINDERRNAPEADPLDSAKPFE